MRTQNPLGHVVFEQAVPRRALSSITKSPNDLYDYTSGRWAYNDVLQRKLAFDVDGLCRLAAQSVHQSPTDVVSISKLAEGGFNRTFVVALRDGRQLVARVPYPRIVPDYYAVECIEYQRTCGIPVPEIYGYPADSDNVAGTPYILMEFVHGPKLSEVWRSLGDEEVISVVRQLTQIESRMMSQPFPAGGSLYFTEDLEKVAPGLGVPLEDKRFCVGPDTKLALWYGRRAGLDIIAPKQLSRQKEIAYLKHFGLPLLPLRRERRPSYKYQQQSPSDHVENLERYLNITSSLVPRDPALSRFYIRHPDLQPNNIFVSRSPGSHCKIVSLFDWQHTSILPMFVFAGRECNPLHYAAFTDCLCALRGRLFLHAGGPWEGETFGLKAALIQATNMWEELTGGGVPCPLEFDAEDLDEMAVIDKEVSEATRGFEILQSMRGVGEEGWVPVEDYEGTVAFFKEYKEHALAGAQSAEEREEIMTHWPWDDMDEDMYM
ncbi:kinase-like domain-containing protein [Lentinula detonsa]|uniref:Kinase-like domain-containing protein n=1 Tax=Lentinula detonsa TaxID=2804962 RepID=A0AA38UXB7_9AGAR|nr:kinase-like domain-containing protein [Lentinula detonsa]